MLYAIAKFLVSYLMKIATIEGILKEARSVLPDFEL